jgi:hypothetical protein
MKITIIPLLALMTTTMAVKQPQKAVSTYILLLAIYEVRY